MLKELHNSRGQEVGFFDTEEKTYHTKRYAQKGQIFLRKNFFNGEKKERAIAIDKKILGELFYQKCQKIIFLIVGINNTSYSVWIKPEEIATKGIKINYDKRNVDGANDFINRKPLCRIHSPMREGFILCEK